MICIVCNNLCQHKTIYEDSCILEAFYFCIACKENRAGERIFNQDGSYKIIARPFQNGELEDLLNKSKKEWNKREKLYQLFIQGKITREQLDD